MYAGIGRRMSSFLFGAGAPQGAALVSTINKQMQLFSFGDIFFVLKNTWKRFLETFSQTIY